MKSVVIRISILFLLSLFFSCNSTNQANNAKSKLVSDSTKPFLVSEKNKSLFKTYRFDATIGESTKNIKDSKDDIHWSNLNDFYSVYRFSKNTYGIGIALPDDTLPNYPNRIFLKAINNVVNEEPRAIDTLCHFSLFRNNTAFKILFSDTARFFYVYCTKGLTTAQIYDVYYHKDECVYFILFRLSSIDTGKFGQPLIASQKKINLTYSNNKDFQRDLIKYDSIFKKSEDYKDTSITPYQFAYNDSLFFTYSDDFIWWKDMSFTCSFPGRSIYKMKNKKVTLYWGDYLELFGIPCD